MTLRVAVQMDPLDSINIAGDSSFALMLSAQSRGHRLWHYDVRSLAWEDGRITARARPVRVQRALGEHYGFEGDEAKIDLAKDIDVVLMRQDPPFDLGYISAALLLDRLKGTTLVVNDPHSVVNAPEKMFVLDYARFMPPTLIARRIEDVRAFQQRHGAVVIKPLHGNGGKAIMRVEADGTNLQRSPSCSARSGPSRSWSSRSFPRWPKATSASCWSTASSPARSTASPVTASSAQTSPRAGTLKRPR
jgi:glutathione synthase